MPEGASGMSGAREASVAPGGATGAGSAENFNCGEFAAIRSWEAGATIDRLPRNWKPITVPVPGRTFRMVGSAVSSIVNDRMKGRSDKEGG